MLVVVSGCVVSGVKGVFLVVSTHFVHLIVHLRRFLCFVVVVAVVVVWRWLAELWSPEFWCCCVVVVRAVRQLEYSIVLVCVLMVRVTVVVFD